MGSSGGSAGGGGAAAGLVHIETQELASAATGITFTNIPATYRHLFFQGRIRSDKAGASTVNVLMTVGTGGALDTGATNYRSALQIVSGTATSLDAGSAGRANAYIGANATPGATAEADEWGSIEGTIFDYTDTTFWRLIQTELQSMVLTSSAYAINFGKNMWKNKAGAINTFRIYPATDNFIIGSQISLYGMA